MKNLLRKVSKICLEYDQVTFLGIECDTDNEKSVVEEDKGIIVAMQCRYK